MVELPGSLERGTLGDILGALHRDRVSGALCLEELGRDYHRHVIHWHEGLIHHVETTRRAGGSGTGDRRAARAAGAESWMQDGAPDGERLDRLDALFELTRARVSFRVMGRRPVPSARPLEPIDFLHGRRRKRDVAGDAPRERAAEETPHPAETPRQAALRTLGLSGDPGPDAVRSAFRKLARRWHPDLHARADAATRESSSQRFIEISTAYRVACSGH